VPDFLSQLAAGLVCGKVSHALAAVNTPRMAAADGEENGKYKAIQISLNNVARSITGSRRNDRTHVVDLLETARLPSVNSMTVSAVVMEAWHAYRSNDGGNGDRNPIGSMVFDSSRVRTTGAGTHGEVSVPLRGQQTLVRG
jgi:hypothetical protein